MFGKRKPDLVDMTDEREIRYIYYTDETLYREILKQQITIEYLEKMQKSLLDEAIKRNKQLIEVLKENKEQAEQIVKLQEKLKNS